MEEKKKPFLQINREKEYLKKSFLDYFKKKKLEKLANSINFFSENNLSKNTITKNRHNKKQIKKSFLIQGSKYHQSNFIWPINKKDFWISSFFGIRKLRRNYSFHYGIDLAALKGTPVKAVADGQIKEAAYSPGYGNTVVITHDTIYKTRYAHLDTIEVKIGEIVQKGQKIGTVGDSGAVRSTGKNKDASHLHFEVYSYGKQINPLYVLQ